MITFKELLEGKFDKSAVKGHIKSMSPEMFTKLYGKTKAEIKDDLKEDIEQIDEITHEVGISYDKNAMRAHGKVRVAAKDHDEARTKALDSMKGREKNVKAHTSRNLAKGKETDTAKFNEEVEQIDELSKGTLASYAKKATTDAVIKRKIAGDFETMSDRSRKPGMKQAADVNAQKYKEQSWKRRHGVEKAIDRLAKEHIELEEAGLEEQAPVAPTLDRKYIKGTPENKAHKEKNKPINGHPTNKMKEETMKTFNQLISSIQEETWTDEQIVEQLNSLTEEDLQGLSIDVLEALAEAVRVYDVSKSNSGTKPKTPEERNKAAAAVKAARANKPKDNYSGKSVTGAGSAGAGARQAGKKADYIAVKEETELDEDISKMSTDKLKKHWDTHKDQTGASPVFAAQLKKVAKELAKRKASQNEHVEIEEGLQQTLRKVVPGYAKREIDKKMDAGKFGKTDADKDANFYRYKKIQDRLKKEEVELDEAFINGREYASQGVMHPDHAKMDIHKVSGNHVDFYASKTGDKMQGKVTKNDGKQVHIQAHKELGDGKLHKFKVSSSLPKQNNEEFENGELETSMKSYKDFLTSIDEALWPGTPEYKKKFPETSRGKVGSETKTSHGTNTVTSTGVRHERDYDKAEKETTEQPTGNMAKRGRGRPAGSKSGARR
jgi:hypothetical protein